MSAPISLVLPVRDGADLTLRCLEAIAREPEGVEFELVVVDDGSQDATPELLAGLEGDVRVLRNDAPRGFGAAADQGVAAASGDHVIVLEPEGVPCAGWLAALAQALNGPGQPAAVVPRSARPDGQWLSDAHWLALGVRRSAYTAVGGLTGSARPGRAEKAALVEALRDRGERVADCPHAVFLARARAATAPQPPASQADHREVMPPSTDLHEAGLDAAHAGDLDRAAALLLDALRDGTRPELLNDLGVVEHARGRQEEAHALLHAAVMIDPGYADAHENLATLGAPAPAHAPWRDSETLGGDDASMPERAFPGMTYTDVMAEHAARYAFAMQLAGGRDVLDLGCGTGYGSEMLTWVARSVRGFDLWQPGEHERPQWPGGALLSYGHDLCRDPLPPADLATMFEVIEHLPDAPAALRTAWGAVGTLVTSFPNPVYHGSHHNHHHVNDWSLDEFERELVAAAGGGVELEHLSQPSGGQLVPGRDPEASYWIVVARR